MAYSNLTEVFFVRHSSLFHPLYPSIRLCFAPISVCTPFCTHLHLCLIPNYLAISVVSSQIKDAVKSKFGLHNKKIRTSFFSSLYFCPPIKSPLPSAFVFSYGYLRSFKFDFDALKSKVVIFNRSPYLPIHQAAVASSYSNSCVLDCTDRRITGSC